MRRVAALTVAALALGACGTRRGYDADPVVGPDDRREVDHPPLGDDDAREDQECFVITLWASGLTYDEREEGIACMVEEEQ